MAARWTTPDPNTPTYKAMKMYRNYDGNKSSFGDTSIAATGPNPDNVSVFAAERSADGGLTIMVISKYLSGNTPASFNIANFPHNGVAQVWQLTGANAISRLADVSFSGNTFGATLPAQSITLFVLSVASGNQSPVAVMAAAPASGVAPLNVSFDGGSSSDADSSIVSYAWNFGDSATGSGVTTNHTYSMSGTYIARLTVTDNQGASSSSTATIRSIPFRQLFPPLRVICLRARYPRLKSVCRGPTILPTRPASGSNVAPEPTALILSRSPRWARISKTIRTLASSEIPPIATACALSTAQVPPLTRTRPPLQHRDEPSETKSK